MGDSGGATNVRYRRALTAALSLPAAGALAVAPSAPAATTLGVEGTLQPAGTTHKAFDGAFCVSNTCTSVNNLPALLDAQTGSRALQSVVDSTSGDLIIMGFSLGAASVYDRLRKWSDYSWLAPDPDRVKLVVTFGNPENKLGGEARYYQNVGLPDFQPYEHLEVMMQYDSVADRPARWGFYSMINTAFARHFDYYSVDINDPDNLVYREPGGSTYMLITAEVLPMLSWLDWFATDEQMAQLDSIFRPLVERDYDRPAYLPQGEGADWGNGTPPPSLQDVPAQYLGAGQAAITETPGEDQPAERNSDVPGSETPEPSALSAASQPETQPTGTDDSVADGALDNGGAGLEGTDGDVAGAGLEGTIGDGADPEQTDSEPTDPEPTDPEQVDPEATDPPVTDGAEIGESGDFGTDATERGNDETTSDSGHAAGATGETDTPESDDQDTEQTGD